MRKLRIAALFVFSCVALFALWLVLVWPPPSWYRTHFPSKTAFMRMRERQARAANDTTPRQYLPVPIDSTSAWLARAAIAGEDDAFLQHRGIDWRSIRHALGYRRTAFAWADERDRSELWRALGGAWAKREKLRGASTITQQLAKNLYLSPSRNPLRKVKEAVIAYRLEMALPKERIMELYLNIAELGPNVWGVEAASRRYFDRPAIAVSMDQAAMLVATLPHPLSSNPSLRPGRTRWRQQLILRRLRGEPIVVPDDADESARPVPADSIQAPVPAPADSSP
jgi:monofunctional biosynthetic peptidoglycan transglycosylase